MESIQPRRLFSYIFILLIAFVFTIQFGPGSQSCSGIQVAQHAAASVNGKEIPLREFNRAYAMQMQYFRGSEAPFSAELARQLGLPKQVLEQLVNAELLAQAADNHGITPSAEEIRQIIHRNPGFQKDGKFDFKLYSDIVRDYYRKTVVDYEQDVRRRLAAGKMLDVVESSVSLSEDELKAKYLRDSNKAQVTFVRFLPTMFAERTKPTPQQVATYKEQHAKEISDYFENNRLLYTKPEQVHARHILIKVDKDAPADRKEAARKQLEDLRKAIEGGKDFATAAKESSEDLGSKDKGGDLGFNDRSSWVPEFAQAAFNLKAGEISQPVETQFGYHLIKSEAKKPAESKELKDVENDIAQELLRKETAEQLAQQEAEKALTAAKAGKSLKALYAAPPKDAKAGSSTIETGTKPEAVETSEFTAAADAVPSLGQVPDLMKDIFAVEKPTVLDKVYPVGEGFVVMAVTARTKPDDAGFAGQKETLRADALRTKRNEVRDAFVKSLRKSAKVVMNEDAIGQAADAT